MQSEPSTSRRRNNELLKILRDRICFLDYMPKQKLSEQQLAIEFNVSRTPIRWALNRLESMELVRTVHGSGSYVTELSRQQIKEIYELRIELLNLSNRLETYPITPEFIDSLKAAKEEMQQLTDHSIRVISYHFTKTYLLIMSLIKNESLRKISEQLYYQSIRIWFTLIPESELIHELNSQITELEQLIEITTIGNIDALFSLRKVNLSINYSKLVKWSVLDSSLIYD